MLTLFLVIAAALVAALIFFFTYGRAETWQLVFGDPDLGHFDRAAPARAKTPNDALLCTPGLCDGVAVDAALPAYSLAPDRLIAAVDESMRGSGCIQRRVDDGSDPARARYVTWSSFMRFPDTNSFEAVELPEGGTGLVAYARAQLGRSDLGKNRERLQAITSGLPAPRTGEDR